jgi:hypothetical protein
MTAQQDLLTIADGIPEAVGTALHDLDLVGDPLGNGVGNRVIEVVEDLLPLPLQLPPGVDELGNPRLSDVIYPELRRSRPRRDRARRGSPRTAP